MANNSGDTLALMERARAGDPQALNEIFARHRDRLRRMVEMRLDRRLQARIDASDVIQDAWKSPRAWRSTSAIRNCLSSSGCGSSSASASPPYTGIIWGRRCATPAGRSRSTATPCR